MLHFELVKKGEILSWITCIFKIVVIHSKETIMIILLQKGDGTGS